MRIEPIGVETKVGMNDSKIAGTAHDKAITIEQKIGDYSTVPKPEIPHPYLGKKVDYLA